MARTIIAKAPVTNPFSSSRLVSCVLTAKQTDERCCFNWRTD